MVVTLRRVLVVTGSITGLILTFFSLGQIQNLLRHLSSFETAGVLILGALFGALAGSIATPLVVWLEGRLQRMPAMDIVLGASGLIVGLIIANLLSSSLSRVPLLGGIAGTLGGLVLGYLGISIAAKKREEIVGLLGSLPRIGGRDRSKPSEARAFSPKILDTSAVIDGRIADVCRSGFIEGPIVIPGFVLEELRHIADSADQLKRNRGRRGLDILNRIQKELAIPVQIYEREVGPNLEVDDRLIRLAKLLGGKIITNDYNLNKVAALQGVPVLNVNELANAIKPVVLPGEEMMVHVIKDGKEAGQGIGYLDDGTMIVVDGGRRHIGDKVAVMVTSVLQTAAGRMIFAKPKANERALP